MVALALIKIWLANAAGAREAALEARALAEAAHRDDLVVNALSALAGAETVEGNLQPVAEYFDEALARAGAMRSTSLSQGMEMTALAQYWIGNYAVSLERNRQAVERAREVADTVTIMRGLSNIGMALVGCGQYGEALATFEEARRFGQAHGLGAWLARQLAIEGGFHLELYDYMGAQALAEQAQELAQAFKFIVAIVSPGIDLLFNYARSGHLARATEVEALVRRSLPGVTGAHLWLLALRFAQARAELAAARWQWREALSLADESLALSRHHGRVKYQVLALQTRALARAHLGQTDLALVDARAAIDLARTTGDPAMFLRAALTSLHLAGDDALAGEARDAARRIAFSLPPGDLRERFEAFVADQL
jgi:tetratricopeptide (TPR) repeat protein